MIARSRRRRTRWCVALLVLAAACRKSSPSHSPGGATMAADDLAAVQAELAGNAEALRALGVVVVVAQAEKQEGKLGGARDDGDTQPIEPSADAPAGELERDEERPNKPSPISPDAEPPPPPKSTTTASIDACGRICALAGAACDLSQRICTLAEQHDGDARYEDLCWNAQRQCEAASDACADCSTC